MYSKRFSLAGHIALVIFFFVPVAATSAWAQTYKVLHNFGGTSDGYDPEGGLATDKKGNLYGVTFEGGARGEGIVYQLAPNGDESWTENVIHEFGVKGGDPGLPDTTLVFDSKGNIYGGTWNATIFQLIPGANGNWSELIIWEQGGDPGAVAFDSAATLYGAVIGSGPYNQGYVFSTLKVSLTRSITLYAFTGGKDGSGPNGPLVFDESGNLYGTTREGGLNGNGTIFKLTPNHVQPGWRETTLYTFQGGPNDGAIPYSGVVFDAAGNLYGTTFWGGPAGVGTVFKLSPNSDGTWTETVLHGFQGGSDGANPDGAVTLDSSGNLYSTTAGGGPNDDGTVFRLSPSSGGQWKETILYSFTGGLDGDEPRGAVVLDKAGNVFGATGFGGSYGGGVAFEITP